MKILVCTDGSEQSQKTLEKASVIAEGCNVNEVAIIHVYEDTFDLSSSPLRGESPLMKEDMERFRRLNKEHIEEKEKMLSEALKIFEEKNINSRAILKKGHPSNTIVNVASEEGFDMIVIGSRGLGGFKKLFLGSVSNAVIQEARNCIVVTVK